jgi:ketosteroid isomerase-like protein
VEDPASNRLDASPQPVSALEERLRRLEDVAAIRALDAAYCRLLDDGDRPAVVALFPGDGVFDGLSRVEGHHDLPAFFGGLPDAGMSVLWHHVSNHEIQATGDSATVRSLLWQPCVVDGVPHVAARQYADELTCAGEGWRYRVKQVRFSGWVPLAERWDRHRFALESARSAAVPRRTPA